MAELVQTLFRCGVCFDMFSSSEECYKHIVSHENEAAAENAATEQTDENNSINSEIQKAIKPTDENETLSVVSVNEEGGEEVTKVAYSSLLPVTQTTKDVAEASTQSGSGQVNTDGVPVQQIEANMTSEDLDIADILINIKQEKLDDNHEATVENVVRGLVESADKTAKSPKTRASARKNKGKKKGMTNVNKGDKNDLDTTPIVRKRKAGVEVDDDGISYACEFCGKRYAILKSLKYHLRTHDGDNLLYCDICEKGFVKPSELTNHKKTHEKRDRKSKGDDGDDVLYSCHYCDKKYKIEKSLKHHEKVHQLGHRYKCDQCDKKFFKPSDVERHKIVHKPLAQCYICKKSFRDPSKLESHVRQHPEILFQGSKDIKKSVLMQCKYCNKKCSTFSQLCNHVRTHTKAKPFPCDICGKKFNRISNMRLHRKLHSGSKPFRCDPCGISFADVTNFKRHFKKYHDHMGAGEPSYKSRGSKVTVVDNLPPPPKVKVERAALVEELKSAYNELEKYSNGEDSPVKSNDLGKSLVQCRQVDGIPAQVQQLINVGDNSVIIPNAEGATPADASQKSTEQVYVVFEDNPSVCYVLEYEGAQTPGGAPAAGKTPGTVVIPQGEDAANMEVIDQNQLQGLPDIEPAIPHAAEIPPGEEDNADDIIVMENDDHDDDDDEEVQDSTEKVRVKKKGYMKIKRYPCQICGLNFKHQGSLRFHFRKHTKEGVMYCEVCNAEFYRKSRLRVHMRDHTGERPYKCTECESTFKVHYDLTVHMRYHTGQGTLKCKHCDRVFYTRRALNSHLKNISNIKPFSCLHCGKLFKRKDQRRRHMLAHLGQLPFKCHMCEHSFGDTSNRKRHIIKVHGKDALSSLPKDRISLVKNLAPQEQTVAIAKVVPEEIHVDILSESLQQNEILGSVDQLEQVGNVSNVTSVDQLKEIVEQVQQVEGIQHIQVVNVDNLDNVEQLKQAVEHVQQVENMEQLQFVQNVEQLDNI